MDKYNRRLTNIQTLIDRVQILNSDLAEIFEAVFLRLEELEDETYKEALENGKCLHQDTLDATTMVDANKGKRRLVCSECGEVIIVPYIKGRGDNSENENANKKY